MLRVTSKTQKIFEQKLPKEIDRESTLVSFDVENLYSNIPHELGLKTISFWLNKYPKELPKRISKDFILEGIKLILENNSFCFNNTYFLQTKGTAMGTKFAPSIRYISFSIPRGNNVQSV